MEEEYRGLGSESWTVRLPVMVGVIFTLLSIPFIAHFEALARDKNNIVIMGYILINYLPLVIHGALALLGDKLGSFHQLFTSYGFAIFFCLMFWVSAAFIVGEFIDRMQKTGETSEGDDEAEITMDAAEQDA